MKKVVFLSLLAIMLVFSGCPDTGSDSTPNPFQPYVPVQPLQYGPLGGAEVKLKMKFTEAGNWRDNSDWSRWEYDYKEDEVEYNLSKMKTDKKVYVLTYSFSSNINIDELAVYFYDSHPTDGDWFWLMISNWVKVNIKTPIIEGGKLYSDRIVLIPNDDASGSGVIPESTSLKFNVKNRNVSTAPILYFYLFKLEEKDVETSEIEEWTVNGKKFTIDTERTNAKTTSFGDKSDVLHIKTLYDTDSYSDFVIKYDLNNYKGKTIEIEMSMDVYLKKEAWVAWQINSSPIPYYPVVCGFVNGTKVRTVNGINIDKNGIPVGPALSKDEWHEIRGTLTYTVPDTESDNDNGKQLYLSGQQIKGAEAYFANATITITEKP